MNKKSELALKDILSNKNIDLCIFILFYFCSYLFLYTKKIKKDKIKIHILTQMGNHLS